MEPDVLPMVKVSRADGGVTVLLQIVGARSEVHTASYSPEDHYGLTIRNHLIRL